MKGVVACAVVSLLSAPALGHGRSLSYSSWELDGAEPSVVLRIPADELARLPWGPSRAPAIEPELAAYLAARLTLHAGPDACAPVGAPRAELSSPDRAVFSWSFRCPSDAPRRIRSELFREVAPGHLHFARVAGAGLERVLHEGDPEWEVHPDADADADRVPDGGEGRAAPASFASWVRLGVDHILTGYDHLAFALALVVMALRVGEVATVVTGFTLGHSLTLALAVLGAADPDRGSVEALIGLSIALVALENGWLLAGRPRTLPLALTVLLGGLALGGLALGSGRGVLSPITLIGVALFCGCYFGLLRRTEWTLRPRIAIAFAFGLVHGFGFAGVLAELELPAGRLVEALFGFNVGVEAGQLAAIAIVWPLLLALRRWRAPAHLFTVELGSAAICGLGVFWFATRAFG